ncbi:MAG: hypothetical protein AAF907_16385 [Planctomycetota bacterium]
MTIEPQVPNSSHTHCSDRTTVTTGMNEKGREPKVFRQIRRKHYSDIDLRNEPGGLWRRFAPLMIV